MLAPPWPNSAAPAISAPQPNTAASIPPSDRVDPAVADVAGVIPLSAEALCWKKIIHGVTVAPIVEATSSSSVLRLPPGNGENVASRMADRPPVGPASIAAARNSPLKIASPSTIRSQRQ